MRFRRQALAQLEAPEQLDEVIRVATVPTWLITSALCIAVLAAGTWAVRATVPRVVAAPGVLVHANGVSGLDSAGGGQVTKVWAKVGQRITSGTPLYSVETADGTTATINAPWDAYVVSWAVSEGQLLQPGTRVADLEQLDAPGDALEAVVFVPATSAPLLKAGLPVDVIAEAAPSTVFGSLSGTVSSVAAFPETAASLQAFLGSGADPARLLGAGSVIRVTVALRADPNSPSGLHWSKTAPPFQLNSESAIMAQFTISKEHPISWLLG
jgi:multidrug efflux pump subunit AcrA (membrane-fusion protein)